MRPTVNCAAEGVPYFTPAQNPPIGTPTSGGDLPTIFTPLKIRGVTLTHRIAVSPMCTHSSENGYMSNWHLAHLGQFALGGASLVMVEATAVEARGRISPRDAGLWEDGQVEPMRRAVDVIHGAGQKAAVQLAHAGRKASDLPAWAARVGGRSTAGPEVGGWPDEIVAPSAVPYSEASPTPRELSVGEIGELVKRWAEAARRSVEAGFDVIEIHGAHGYLNNQFLSPVSNKRTDDYGGSFENRTRLLREIITSVRGVIPATMPLFLRVSATEWLEHTGRASWTVDDTIRLARSLPSLGVDLLDVSSSGNHPDQIIPVEDRFYQADIAGRIRAAMRDEGVGLLVGAVGQINEAGMAREVVQEGGAVPARADLVFVGRQFLKEPGWVMQVAQALGVDLRRPVQYAYAVTGMERLKEKQREKKLANL